MEIKPETRVIIENVRDIIQIPIFGINSLVT